MTKMMMSTRLMILAITGHDDGNNDDALPTLRFSYMTTMMPATMKIIIMEEMTTTAMTTTMKMTTRRSQQGCGYWCRK